MRRSIARGRVFPQSYSTDRRYGRLSLKACALFPLMWVNADDQGRLCGDPEEVKYAVCPNIDHIAKPDVPELLVELERNSLIKVYQTPKSEAIQILDWWDTHQKMQWAWPSEYPPLETWQDHLRYKKDAHTVLTLNWPVSGEPSGDNIASTQVRTGADSGERSPEPLSGSPLETPFIKEKEIEKETERGSGNSPECSGDDPSLSLTDTTLLEYFIFVFAQAFGRAPNTREVARLRDFGIEVSSAGGASSKQVYDAFKEACNQNKFSVSYVRAVLLDWLGIERVRSP